MDYREELKKLIDKVFNQDDADEKSTLANIINICDTIIEQQLQEKDKVIKELQEKLKPPVCHDVEKYYEEEI